MPSAKTSVDMKNFLKVENGLCRLVATFEGSSELAEIGRPNKQFEKSSERAKRRKTEDRRASTSPAELAFATSMSYRSKGDESVAKIIKELRTTPSRARRVLSKWRAKEVKQSQLTPEEAPSMIVSGNFMKHQYLLFRRTSKMHGHSTYPSYKSVLVVKNATYPKDIIISEGKCELDLQIVLTHTASRIYVFLCLALPGRWRLVMRANALSYANMGLTEVPVILNTNFRLLLTLDQFYQVFLRFKEGNYFNYQPR